MSHGDGAAAAAFAYPGRVLCETARSRLYQVKASFLTSYFTPDTAIQRNVESVRVDSIVESAKGEPHFPGTVCIFDFEGHPVPRNFPSRGIFDGQHRTAALARIIKLRRQQEPQWDTNVVIEVFPVVAASEVRRLFIAVNQAQPVQPYVIDFVRRDHRKLADEAVRLLVEHNPKWKGSMVREPVTAPRSPHIKEC